MTRENQSLQIALIVIVVVTILLIVATYVCYHKYQEESLKTKSLQTERDDLAGAKNGLEASLVDLKICIGVGKDMEPAKVKEAFDKDMKDFDLGYNDEDKFYRSLLEKMFKSIQEKKDEVAELKQKYQELDEKYKAREAAKDAAMKRLEEENEKCKQDFAAEQAKFKTERDRITQDQKATVAEKETIRKNADVEAAQLKAKIDAAEVSVKKQANKLEELGDMIRKLTGEEPDNPQGQVVLVDQRNHTVWINLGRADGLKRQVSFGVYPVDANKVNAKENKKGSIEITQVLNEHLAEARITDDQAGNPIVQGDKIYTTLWSSGQKKHFALAGFFDIDGSGRNALALVKNVIQLNGGVIDCYIGTTGADRNKVVGEVTVNTNYLILGDAPEKAGDAAMQPAFTKIYGDAKQFRIPILQIGDLLQKMGWKNPTPVVRFGHGANPADFRPKPDGDVPRKSNGHVSEIFEKRVPGAKQPSEMPSSTPSKTPSKAPSSAYHRF